MGVKVLHWLSFAVYFSNMSRADIISEIPKLSHEARREIMRCLMEAEEEAMTLAECDQRALERFQMLDQMEAEDEKNAAR
jgi:FlaA1/EpsC-like NDP-sugar epimerase